ncbi:hypothetical protein JL721_4577 [Aureococcus anophagefferens]|nr:hypothetical protein JL721_4577 [Aureococcus anophagefferens]
MTVMAAVARAALVLAAVAESEPVSRSEPERGPYCEDVRVHDFHGDNEGYGNQMHALIMAAEMAVPCNMTLLIPMKGRFGHICSRLGCDAPFVRRRDFGAQMKKHEAGEDPSLDESPWAAYTDLPPFEEVAKPVVDYLEREGLRKRIFLAGNVPAAKAAVAARFVDAVVVCAVDADADVVRHPNKLANDNLDMRNDPSLCDDCLDVTFGEWSYLAKATKLVVQLGMHCVGDGDCLDPRERIYGRRSSFSLSAATFAAVPSTIIVDPAAPLDPADFTPPGYRPPKGVGGLAMSCSLQPAMDAMRAGRRRR